MTLTPFTRFNILQAVTVILDSGMPSAMSAATSSAAANCLSR